MEEMKIMCGDTEVCVLEKHHIDLLQSEIPSSVFEEDIHRRVNHIVMHKYNKVYKRFFDKWINKLVANGVTSIPTGEKEFIELVMARSDYKDAQTIQDEQKVEEENIE